MLSRAKWHHSLTDQVIMEAAERQQVSLDDPGFCLACGNEQGGCEPDMRHGICEACGELQVYGAEELAMSLDWIDDDDALHEHAELWAGGKNRDGD